MTGARNVARSISHNDESIWGQRNPQVVVDSLRGDCRQVIAFFVIAAERAASPKVMPDSCDAQLGLSQLLHVAGEQTWKKSRISRERFKQPTHARAELKDLAGRGQVTKYFHRGRFDYRQELSYLPDRKTFTFERLTIDRQVGLTCKIDLIDSPAGAKDLDEHCVYQRPILAAAYGLDQRAVDVEQDDANVVICHSSFVNCR